MSRRMSRIRPIAAVALAAAFLACEASPTSPGALNDAATQPLLDSEAGNPVVRSARGSGHHQGPNIGGSEVGWRVFTFNAIQRQDGTTTGNVKYDTHDQGDPAVTHRAKGQVFCMTDMGNELVGIGAEGTQRTPYDVPGAFPPFPPADPAGGDWGMFFVVRDNGEGTSASGPDQFTGVVNTDIASVVQLCALGMNHPLAAIVEAFLNDVDAGNIQVSW